MWMALLQALLAFLARSTKKIVNTLFGWAVTALFGPPGAAGGTHRERGQAPAPGTADHGGHRQRRARRADLGAGAQARCRRPTRARRARSAGRRARRLPCRGARRRTRAQRTLHARDD